MLQMKSVIINVGSPAAIESTTEPGVDPREQRPPEGVSTTLSSPRVKVEEVVCKSPNRVTK